MPDQRRFTNEDLVLRVSNSFDPAKFNLAPYEPFIDALCQTREYQKEAIRTSLRFLLGGRYSSTRQLAEENFHSSQALQERHGTFAEMERHLQLPDKIAASLDLATSSGKSYVMYGIARIMLAMGVVDRVLVLCPSLTIERGLLGKFRLLSGDAALKELIPQDARIRNPHIIDASETIVDGTICIENFHATLRHVGSSIRDSLREKGEQTLVLNDEVHHVYSPPNQDLGRWKEFLLDPEFDFRYILGFSGTCYTDNDYFTDVISRYSLRLAIEQGFAKSIEYVAEDSSGNQDEKFQKIYDNHYENKHHRYRKVKPLTILVTKDIAACNRLTEDLTTFLAQQEGTSVEDATRKVLTVTSARQHQTNIPRLEEVDSPDSPVEWIASVSMLTEGWDVKNVFQIVPHEERAFNSKLLIAQVLGRGLRIPAAYLGERPVVIVFNHDSWSHNIKHLVDEVIEVEKRVVSFPARADYNFVVDQIDYSRNPEVDEVTAQTGEYEFTKGYVTLTSQVSELESETTYSAATTGVSRQKRTLLKFRMHPVNEVAEHIYAKFQAIDEEVGTNYAERHPLPWLENLIRESLRRVGEANDHVSEENRQRLQRAFGVVHRGASQTVRYRMQPQALRKIDTSNRRRDSVGVASLRRQESTVFYDERSLQLSDEESRIVLQEVIDDVSLPRSAIDEIRNSFDFKTPLNVVIADHTPERLFVKQLMRSENAQFVDGWIKSTDQDFYTIEYSWRKGEHAKRATFNPDFFIKQGSHIWVIEIKGDEERGDPSDENKAKYKAAKQHFDLLNTEQSETVYRFHFLTPTGYPTFFSFIREANIEFVSEIDVILSENGH